MRRAVTAVTACALLVACNSILGVGSDYHLSGAAGEGASAGKGGTGNSGGKGSGGRGGSGEAGDMATTSGGASTGGSGAGRTGADAGQGGDAESAGDGGGPAAGDGGSGTGAGRGGASGMGGSAGQGGTAGAGALAGAGGVSASGGNGGTAGTAGNGGGAGTTGGTGGALCATDRADCDDNPTDCETPLDSIASCGTSCEDVHSCSNNRGAPSCSSGACVMACNQGYADCGGPNDGCESDLTATATCGKSCADRALCDALSAATCVNGGCSNPWAAWPMPDSPVAEPATTHPQSYTDNGDGTITDNVTGLVWEKVAALSTYSWSDGTVHCLTSSVAGYQDWRLPTRIELLSLVDYGRNDPAIDTTYFPQTQSSFYWTSSNEAGSDAWQVHFGGGDSYTEPENSFVRCVR